MIRYLTLLIWLLISGCQLPDRPKNPSVEPSQIPQALTLSGKPLYAAVVSPEATAKRNEEYQRARQNYLRDSTSLENIIWYGRRSAYLQNYRQAVEIFTRGLQNYGESARIYRHRGHRFITLRKFDQAIADLTRAAQLIKNQPLQIEADGLPNKLNIPLSNTQFNIYYHLGLAYYLKGEFSKAIDAYQECLKYCNNDDLMVATVDWMYMSLKRNRQHEKAEQLLKRIEGDLVIVENDSYYQRILMYQGIKSPDSLLAPETQNSPETQGLILATQGYGVANWYYCNGDSSRAFDIMQDIVASDSWAAFGFIAAEADLFRWEIKKGRY